MASEVLGGYSSVVSVDNHHLHGEPGIFFYLGHH